MEIMYRLKKIVIKNMQGILYIIEEILLICVVIYLRAYDSKIMALIFSILTILIIIANSGLKYKKGITNHSLKSKLILLIRIMLAHTLLTSTTSFIYEVSLGKVFEQKSIYGYYNLLVAYIFISYTVIIITGILRRRKRLIKEKAGIAQHLFYALTPVIIFYFFVSSYLYILLIPKRTIDINVDVKPASLSVSEQIRSGGFPVFKEKINLDKIVVVEDNKLIESFLTELSQAPMENLRGLEYFHQNNRGLSETYYWIYADYKDSKINLIMPEGVDKLLVFIKLYKNGDLILSNYKLKHNILVYPYNEELYKFTLSKEFTEKIIGMFE